MLWALWEEDPALLPRAHSRRSGAVFEKLLTEHFASYDLIPDIDQYLKMDEEGHRELVLNRALVSVYLPPAEPQLLFDRELVEIHAGMLDRQVEALRSIARASRRMAEIAKQPGERGEKTHDVGDEIKPGAVLLPLFGQLAVLTASESASPLAKAAGLEHLERIAGEMSDQLLAEKQEVAQDVLAEVRRAIEANAPEAPGSAVRAQ
jgi:hypothetical protein